MLLFLLCFSVLGTEVRAQAQGQQDPDDRPDPAPADTARYATLFDRIGFHPELNSRFEVNRSATTFRQGANIRRHFGATLVNSDWHAGVQSNSTQNDRRQTEGVSTTRVARSGRGEGGWKFGSKFGLNRRAVTTTFTRNVINDTKIDLVGESGALGHFTRELLGLDEAAVDWNLDGSFGALRKESVNERNDRTNPALLESADSTRADGTNWVLTSDLGIVPAEGWQLDISGGLTQGRQAYDTLLRPNADSVAVQGGTNRDRSRDLDLNAVWRPSKGQELRVRTGWDVSTSQYYSTTEKAQETTDQRVRGLEVAVLAEPLWGIATELKASSNNAVSRFALSESGASKDGHSFQGRASFTLGRPFAWFDGTEVIIEGNTGTTSTVYQDETPSFDEDVVYLKGSVKRSWRQGTSATLSATGDLSQKYYEELEGGVRQDLDRLKQRVDFALSYQLRPSVETVFSVNWAKTSTINILAARAAANVDENSISTGGRYSWTVWNDTRLTQELILNAASSTRPYNEDESSLRRTTSLRSSVQSLLAKHARLSLEHYFQFQDQGAYRIEPNGGIRRFLRDTENLTQRTEAEVRYIVRTGIEFYYRQKFEVRGTKNLIAESVNRRRTIEIKWGGDVRHNIDEDFYMDIGFDRISSTVENSYWVGSAQVSRLF